MDRVGDVSRPADSLLASACRARRRRVRLGETARQPDRLAARSGNAPQGERIPGARGALQTDTASRPVADIDITRPHRLGLDGAREAAEAVAARLAGEFGVRSAWAGDTLRVEGRGVHGALEASAAAVRVTASLGLMARPFRRALRREIERELDRVAPLPA